MKIAYARTSTVDQEAGLEAQLRDLKAAGAEKIFSEKVSSVDVVRREQLALALDFIREGDTLIVTKLDRLARSVAHLLAIVDQLKAKGASLQVLNLGIDTSTPTGKLMLTMLGGIAEFERGIMLERQREGIAKAKREGKYAGRQPTARNRKDEVVALFNSGLTPSEITAQMSGELNSKGKVQPISLASVYRLISEAKKDGKLGEVRRVVAAA